MFSNLVTLFWKFSLFKEGEGEATAKLPSIMFSAPSLSAAASDLIVTSPSSVRFMPGGKNGKYATSVRPSLKKPARSHDGFGGEPFKGFHATVFIPTGAGTASGVPQVWLSGGLPRTAAEVAANRCFA